MESSHGSRDLHGWKEIAAYLGKSVRAVQRWERDLGLPVHRIRTAAGGQSIYARREEIDAWRERLDTPPPPDTVVPEVPDVPEFVPPLLPDPATPAAPVPAATRRHVPILTALALVVITFAVSAAWLRPWDRRQAAPPALRFALVEDRLVATDTSGRERWSAGFPHPLTREAGLRKDGAQPEPSDRVRTADIDGDGRLEVLAMVRFSAAPAYVSDALYCFDTNGTLRWSFQPNETVTFGEVSYGAPWLVTDVLADERPAGERRVWLAVNHHMWWPSMVYRLSADGRAERVYAHAGGTYALKWWTAGGRPRLFAAGISNDHGGAALTVLDPSSAPSVPPPSDNDGFACASCGTARPEAYFVFPPSDVNRAAGYPYNRGSDMDRLGTTTLRVFVQEDLRKPDVLRIFSISPDLHVVANAPVDYFWPAHTSLEQAGSLDHSAADCPHRLAPARVRAWTPQAGWHDVMVPSTAPRMSDGRGQQRQVPETR